LSIFPHRHVSNRGNQSETLLTMVNW